MKITLDRFTVVFDLEETLTHVSEQNEGADGYIPVTTSDGQKKTLGVHYRPFLKDCLLKLKKAGCEVAVWASGQSEYSNKIINSIDANLDLFEMRLFKD